MLILTPKDNLFNYDEAKKLYEQSVKSLQDTNSFDEILERNHFFSFYIEKKFIGCIYFYDIDGKLFFNGFAGRKTHKQNIECIKSVLKFYNCDIYARSTKKPAILCLLKAGFKKIDDSTYKYERR